MAVLQSVKNKLVAYLNVRFGLFGAPSLTEAPVDKQLVDGSYSIVNTPVCTIELKLHWKFTDASTIKYPATFVATLPDGRVWGHEGIVIDNHNRLFGEVSRHYNDKGTQLQIFTQRIQRPVYRKARIAVLATAGQHVYYHWMLDVVPRLGLLQKAGLAADIGYFVIEYTKLRFQTELLRKMGIDESRIIASNDPFRFHLQASQLIVPSLVSPNDAPSLEACLFLRNLFIKDRSNKKPFRRLYIQRKKGRTIINEEQLITFLTAQGFEIICPENLTVAQQAHLFSEASFVIAPHGAGLTNLVFCEPGTKVIDIFSPAWVNPCYWILSSHLQLQYAYLMGEGAEPVENYDPQQKTADIHIDIRKFKNLFEKLNSGRY